MGVDGELVVIVVVRNGLDDGCVAVTRPYESV